MTSGRPIDKAPKKPRIKYAGGPDGKLPYFSGAGLTTPGARGPWAEDQDNPMSSNFIPPEERGEHAKARWWALHGRKGQRQDHGEYDAKPA